MSAGTVVVRGHAALPAEPDELRVRLTVSAVEPAPDVALAEAGRLIGELGRLLDELAIPASDRSESGPVLREEFESIVGRWTRLGYRATNAVVVRPDGPACAARLLREAVARAGAQVDGMPPGGGGRPSAGGGVRDRARPAAGRGAASGRAGRRRPRRGRRNVTFALEPRDG